MLHPRLHRSPAALAAALAWAAALTGCVSTPDDGLSTRQRELAEADLGEIPDAEIIVSSDGPIGEFLAGIDLRIEKWFRLGNSEDDRDRYKRESLEADIERFVSVRVDELVDELATGPLRNRMIAASGLGFAREEEVLGPLLAALDDPSDQVIGQALLGLGVRADPETPLAPLLDPLRRSIDEYVRGNASYAVFRCVRAGARSDELAGELRRALIDSAPVVRLQAAGSLGVIGDAEAVDDLGVLLEDEINLVFLSALEALAQIAQTDMEAKGPVARELVDALENAPRSRRDLVRREAIRLSGKDFGGDLEFWRRWAVGLP